MEPESVRTAGGKKKVGKDNKEELRATCRLLVIDSARGGRVQMVTWGYRCEEEGNESEGSLEISFWTCLILRSFYEPSKAVCQAGNC